MKRTAEGYQARHPSLAVRFGFLESADPLFSRALVDCARQFHEIQVLPLFLFHGAHVQKDIPEIIQTAQKKHPGCLIRLAPALAAHPALAKLSLKRLVRAGYARQAPLAPVLLVGHGAEEATSPNPLLEAGKFLAQENPVGPVEACFIGLGEPSLGEKLGEWKKKFPGSCWWAAPYLLFPGFFLEKIQREISAFQSRNPTLKIFIAPPLGADEFLLEALEARRSEIK